MTDHSYSDPSNYPSSFRPQPAKNTPLDKIFRLYSPHNYIPVPKLNYSVPKKQNQKAVIQLIFPHPNLLFIHPQSIKDPAEKQAFLELNMMKNIIERKQQIVPKNFSNPKNLVSSKAKPMTAPHLRRKNDKNMSFMSIQKKETDDSMNVCTLICDKQSGSQDFQSMGMSWRKSKTFTSKSQFRKAHLREKENQELRNEKEFKNKVLSKNTFEFMLEEKKKELTEKYDDDKMMREELYRKSVKSPTTQMYIDIEGKFLKYFRQP